jgi:hypothetical protein
MHRAARHPKLEAAVAAHKHLRARGVGHEEAVERVMDYVMEGAATRESN